jgi:5-formyltetrahydrofolate cyclo-ligase
VRGGNAISRIVLSKRLLRTTVWNRLEEARAAAFPGPYGRVPNFHGAVAAARRLVLTPDWRHARVVMCNPDSAQWPVRVCALNEGKSVYMAVPRLCVSRCFWELDPNGSGDVAWMATIAGAARLGRPVHPFAIPRVDLFVVGSVAVNRGGARLGKGSGYSDLAYAVGRSVGYLSNRTTVVTTVHRLQILKEDLPVTTHDLFVNLIATPHRIIRTVQKPHRQPRGIVTSHLTEALCQEIPILRELGF